MEKFRLKMNAPKTKLMKVMIKQDGTVKTGQETVEEVEELFITWVVSSVKLVANAKISRYASIKQDMHSRF